ncbi:hypothetical protein [Bradyrhizobium liaoningense]|uniref:hypothetical protein n=1 Tax=Bradyrhizobium liaoningense TaxID=43992 RepID=UPI001BA58F04|nr:hypothetical protein [Bradyrhizobium liaoningense]MBR0906605.1 hypothetical protein [Bradyrhizobium liaoningense]
MRGILNSQNYSEDSQRKSQLDTREYRDEIDDDGHYQRVEEPFSELSHDAPT